jgi:hypothetical protein
MHAPNTDVALYIPPNGAPNPPDRLIRGALLPAWRSGMQENDGNALHAQNLTWKWDSILEVLAGTDIRDTWPLAPGNFLYIPNAQGQQYLIVEVEGVRVLKGKDYLRVYLRRTTWINTGGAAMEVKQASGTPDYLNITTLVIDQANGLTLSQPSAGQAQVAVLKQMSIDVDASGLKLKNDLASPGANMVYGTDGSGNKGWQSPSDMLLASSSNSNAATINITGLTGYKWYEIVGYDFQAKHSLGTSLFLLTSTNGGSTWDNSAGNYQTPAGSAAQITLGVLPDDSAVSHMATFRLWMPDLGGTSLYKFFNWEWKLYDGSNFNGTTGISGTSQRNTTSAVNAIQLLAQIGNLNGTVRVYGYN